MVAWPPGLKPFKEGTDEPCIVTVDNQHKYTTDKPDPKKYSIDFWKLRKVHEKEHSNMELEMIEQKVPLPSIRSEDVASTCPSIVQVPSAKLTRDVHKGDELVLFLPKANQPDKKRPLNVVFQPVAGNKSTVGRS